MMSPVLLSSFSRPFGSSRVRAPLLLAMLLALAQPLFAQRRQPVYVGAQACAPCHEGKHMGDQFTRWYLSKHATAYTSLSKPEAKEIARLSGIPMDPQKSAMCLGCHATGAEAEDWEKDDTFSEKEGVSCEKCHGPGSEYMDARIMVSREASVKAGLIMPTREHCMMCHKEKGSHTRVLKRPPLDMEKAWNEIAHPTPENWYEKRIEPPPPPRTSEAVKTSGIAEAEPTARPSGAPSGPKYTGTAACAECHTGADSGFQFSRWRDSKHARAYADLGTPRGYAIAKEMKIEGDPQTSIACLKCHATAYSYPSAGVQERYSVHEGVGCEACHGPGSEYSPEAVMKDKAQAHAAGLRKITAETCAVCHANAHGKPFDYDKALAEIAHPTRLPPPPEEIRYKTPLNLALRPGGREIYVTCEAAYSVIVVDPAARRKVAEIPVGGQPMAVTFHPGGKLAYVSNRLDDSVSVVDADARKVVATIPVGDEPHGLLTDRSGKYLYVLNTSSDDISVIDTATLAEVKRLEAGRGPWSLALSPDGSRLLATNMFSRFVPYRKPSVSEVTVIEADRAMVVDRIVVPDTNLVQGVAWHPSGKYAYNDGDGSTGFDREFVIFLNEVWSFAHWCDSHVQLPEWSEYNPDFWLLNGRVYPDTLAPNGQGNDGPGYVFQDEFHPSLTFSDFGVLAMANSGTNSNGSQFFITVAGTPWLNNVHTIFGRVTSGSNVVYAISRVATGAAFNVGEEVIDYSTPKGDFTAILKMPSRHMRAPENERDTDAWFDLPGVPWNIFFTYDGIAIHGTYWHNDYGLPRSHGCVNVPIRVAKWIYFWANPVAPYEDDFVQGDIPTVKATDIVVV